jgi:hypothetical protein
MKVLIHVHRFAHVASTPVAYIVRNIPHSRKKKTVKVCIGTGIMLVGSTMATHPLTIIPHIVWDAIAWGLHGYGALPIIKVLCSHLDLENLDDSEVEKLKSEIEKLNKKLNERNENE